MAWRYHVQRAITNEWMNRDAVVRSPTIEWALSGPGELTFELDAIAAAEIGPDGILLFDEWSTLIYAEEDNTIRWGGIVSSSADIGNGERSIVATSFSGYPTGRVYLGELRFYESDAFDIIRMLWEKVQEDPHADLNVNVSTNDSGVMIGSADPGAKPVQADGESLEDYEARVVAWQSSVNEPYELAWWNTPDFGNEIEGLILQSGGEYVENHTWTGDKVGVAHNIDLYYPDAGSRRYDLRFMEGENVVIAPQPERDGGLYGNYVIALGAGEDRHTLRFEAGRSDGRLRRDIVVPIKDTYSPSRLEKEGREALDLAQEIMSYDTIEVLDHPNAEIGSWQLGDEILLQTHSGYEKIQDWVRIVGWSVQPDTRDTATLKVMRVLV